MRRPLNDTEKMVLRRAREFEQAEGRNWAAPDIQRAEYPHETRFRSVELGISPAIQRLVRIGLVKRIGRGFPAYYRVAQQAQGQGGE